MPPSRRGDRHGSTHRYSASGMTGMIRSGIDRARGNRLNSVTMRPGSPRRPTGWKS